MPPVSSTVAGEQLGALPDEEGAPAHQVAGGAFLARINVGVGEIAAAQQRGDLQGVDAIVLGLAAMDGLHVEGVPEDELDALLGTEVGDSVPAEQALDRNDESLAVGLEGTQELVSIAGELAVDEGFAVCTQDADIEAAGVEVDATRVNMLFRVESH